MRKIFINVKTQVDGVHCYPDAPEEVSFLRNLHHHVFHITAKIEVFHEDRELEFLLVKKYITENVTYILKANSASSCEMIADRLLTLLGLKYGKGRALSIEVSEDGGNGAIVEYIAYDKEKK